VPAYPFRSVGADGPWPETALVPESRPMLRSAAAILAW
jgi:hypothetical protein